MCNSYLLIMCLLFIRPKGENVDVKTLAPNNESG